MKVLEKGNPSIIQWRPGAVWPGPCSVFTAWSLLPNIAMFLWFYIFRMLWLSKAPLHNSLLPYEPRSVLPSFSQLGFSIPKYPQSESTQQPFLLSHTPALLQYLPSLKAFHTTLPLHMPVPPSSTRNAFCWFRSHPFLCGHMSPLSNTGNVWASYINVKPFPFADLFLKATVTSFQSCLPVS